jgi:uncharacterized membrane protein
MPLAIVAVVVAFVPLLCIPAIAMGYIVIRSARQTQNRTVQWLGRCAVIVGMVSLLWTGALTWTLLFRDVAPAEDLTSTRTP